MKRPLTYLTNILLTLLLILSLIGTAGAMLLHFQALNADTCRKIIRTQEIPQKVHENLSEYFTEQENATGIPASVYASAITEEKLEAMMLDNIRVGFDYLHGKSDECTAEHDFTELETELNSFFTSYAEENGFPLDAVFDEALNTSIEAAESKIQSDCDAFCFAKLDDAGVMRKARKAVPYCGTLTIVVLVMDAVLLLLLLIVNRKERKLICYWCGIALLLSGLLMLIPAQWLQITRWFDRFAVKSAHIFNAVCGYLYKMTGTISMISVIHIAAAVVLLLLFILLNRKKPETKH